MPIQFKSTGGYLRNGQFYGDGQMISADDDGNGEIQSGTFFKSQLHCESGEIITYTDKSFTKTKGTFVNGIRHGIHEIITYTDNSEYTDDEKCIDGNAHCKTRGIRFIHANNTNDYLEGKLRTAIYDNGYLTSITSPNNLLFTINVNQHYFNGRTLFDKLDIIKE